MTDSGYSPGRLWAVLERQQEFIVGWLPDGTRTFVNPAYCHYFAASQEELLGTSFRDLVEAETWAEIEAEIAARTPEDPWWVREHRTVTPEGSLRWQRWTNRAIFDEAGELLELQSVGMDIHEWRVAEELLRERERSLSRAQAMVRMGSFTFDVPAGTATMSPEAQAIFGPQVAGITQELFGSHVHPEDRAAWDEASRAIIGGEVDRFELGYRFLSPRGSIVDVIEISELERNKDGSPSRVFGILLDVTGQKQVERRLKQALAEVEELRVRLEEENLYLREEARRAAGASGIIGSSQGMSACVELIDQVAPTDATVLITGETGTGKELVARRIHERSHRAGKPLISVNCAALPAELVESELFGHVAGAFSGAVGERRGRFELADGGTIFLDEIGELAPAVQAKLLRVLQERVVERLGSEAVTPVDVRIVAATNRDLQAEVRAGTFRADLYYRIQAFPIAVPPLREHLEDIPELVDHFLDRLAARLGQRVKRVAPEVIRQLQGYSWPGNVRELEHLLERSLILCRGDTLERVSMPEVSSSESPARSTPPGATPMSLEAAERAHILEVLQRCTWRIEGDEGAAAILAIAPSTLRSRMKRLGIRRPRR